MERPRMKRTLELVASGGHVYVLRPAEEADLRIELDDDTSRALLAALDGIAHRRRARARVRS